MKITGTFIDALSSDITPLNWGIREWDKEFYLMKQLGIDTVVLLRTGFKEWLCYPSEFLQRTEGYFKPPFDFLKMYLELAEKYGIKLFVGTYNSNHDWLSAAYNVDKEAEVIMESVNEIWGNYGKSPAFAGWYMTHEISRKISFRVVELFQKIVPHCKKISGNLPVLMSPGMDGIKAGHKSPRLAVTPEEHREDWDWIMGELSGIVDIIAFQDGHVDFKLLGEFLSINSELAKKHKIECWTNAESFDRDLGHAVFPPIRWDKLLLKLETAERTNHKKAITFEFPHFMSPYSVYPGAKYLLDRYCEHYNLTYEPV